MHGPKRVCCREDSNKSNYSEASTRLRASSSHKNQKADARERRCGRKRRGGSSTTSARAPIALPPSTGRKGPLDRTTWRLSQQSCHGSLTTCMITHKTDLREVAKGAKKTLNFTLEKAARFLTIKFTNVFLTALWSNSNAPTSQARRRNAN